MSDDDVSAAWKIAAIATWSVAVAAWVAVGRAVWLLRHPTDLHRTPEAVGWLSPRATESTPAPRSIPSWH